MPENPAQKIGKYPILRLLGQGAMGKVYLGEDPFIGRQVAIKVLSSEGDEEAHRRFLEEARTVGQLSHPQIVTLLEFGFHEGSPFLVMELLKGESLEAWLGRPHSLAELLRVLRDLSLAVAHAHSHGVLHRDIKPSNAQVLNDGSCKLMDFGIARSQRMKLTATGMVVGTPQFIAPEVLRDASYTSASDTYALGVVAYQVLAGHNPFAAGTLEACLTKVLTLAPPPLAGVRPDVPAELADLIDGCLTKDPALRPDIGHLLHGLERALAALPLHASGGWIADTAMATYALPKETAQAKPPAPPARKTLSRGKLAGLAVGLLVALVAAGLFFQGGRKEEGRGEEPKSVAAPPVQQPAAIGTEAPETGGTPRDAAESASLPSQQAGLETAPARPQEAAPAPPPAVKPAAESTRTPAPASSQARTSPQTEPKPAKQDPERPTPLNADAGKTAASGPAQLAADPAEKAAALPQKAAPPSPSGTAPAPPPAAAKETATPPADAVSAPKNEALPLLHSLSPSVVRRGSSTVMEILGERLGKIGKVQIYRGLQPATGIEVRRLRSAGDGKLTFSLFVDSNARLGSFSVHVVDEAGQVSNSLSLEVGL